MTARVALVGDLHGSWDESDVRAFNASDYELLVFTGDLGSGTAKNGVAMAQSMSRLTKPAVVMPGNNDVPFLAEIAAEFGHQRGLADILELGEATDERRAQIRLTGYEALVFTVGEQRFTIVTGRPFAMGGNELSFAESLARNYDVHSMEESTKRLNALIDEVETERLIILGHNGPYGLGGLPTDIWGCDFLPEHGDWGDHDLASAIQRAMDRGLELLVVAGHMHHHVLGGGQRQWRAERRGVPHVNPARVPRIYADENRELRYHVAVDLDRGGFDLEEIEWD
ncbi:MAG: metallophosphoesterase [Myxococcota bacterium]